MKSSQLACLSAVLFAAGLIVALGADAEAPKTQVIGTAFTGTGANRCIDATVVPVPVGPVGSPLTVTISGDNTSATDPDCAPPFGVHVGPVWWEAFQITERALVTIDLCGTTPVQDPSYYLIYRGCVPAANLPCNNPTFSEISGRGAPFCADGNLGSTFPNLNPGICHIPVLSDPNVLLNGLGPYVMHIHASACPGACCDTNQQTCVDCVDSSTCTDPGEIFHPGESCFQARCFAPDGPDLIAGAVWDCEQLGRQGAIGSGTVAMACNTTACNIGNERGNWLALPDTDHPVMAVNLYRMESVAGNTRFEQLGHSWLKHAFDSANINECGVGCEPNVPYFQIGVGCSDTYHGVQFDACNLGPRSMIHPYTGVMPGGPDMGPIPDCGPFTSNTTNYPANDHRDHVHSPISHKVQVLEADLNQLVHLGARFFGEGFYIAPHEYTEGNGNQNNNVSRVELAVGGPDIDGVYSFTELGSTIRESPAVDAWAGASRSVIEPAPLADGRAILAWQATDLGAGQWHYEYAIYNMNLDRALGSLCIPLAPGVVATNVGFHAPLNHALELHADSYSNNPWASIITDGAIRWETQRFTENPLANAVRFGTLYNMRFDADAPPQTVNAVVGLFKTGVLTAVALQGPSPTTIVDLNSNGIADACETTVPGIPQGDPSGIEKTRFISFGMPAGVTAAVGETALRVKLTSLHHVSPPYTNGVSIPFTQFEGQSLYVGPPVQYVESSSDPTPFLASKLQCDPDYRDWTTVGFLHVTGEAITPSSSYDVEFLAFACQGRETTAPCLSGGANVSAVLTIKTARSGDVAATFQDPTLPASQPDFDDIGALVNKFKSLLGAPIKAQAKLYGVDAHGSIDMTPDVGFDDISLDVDAFKGVPYPYKPGKCTGDPATACKDNTECVGTGPCILCP